MVNDTFSIASNRRQFLCKMMSMGTIGLLGCRNLFAYSNPQDKSKAILEKHKFNEDSEMSFSGVYNFAYQDLFIPFMKNLSNEIGKENFINLLKDTSSKIASQNGKNWGKNVPQNNFSNFNSWAKDPDRFWDHVLTTSIVEDTDKVFEVKITECLWAKTFRDNNASDIGYASICHQDYAYCQAYNPGIKMIRTKTLMQGDNHCNHRWICNI